MKKTVLVLILTAVLLLAGSCAGNNSASTGQSASSYPDSTDTTVTIDDSSANTSGSVETDKEVGPDVAFYAEHYGITVEEAEYRLQLQQEAGIFGAELEKNESDTLTGFWIEHEPEFRLVAAFTKNGEETIEKYRDSYPDLVAITAVINQEYTQAQLEEAQQQITVELRNAGLSFSSMVDIMNNRVKLFITDTEVFQSTLATYNIELPDCVDPVVIYEPLDEPPAGLNPDPSIHMAQLKVKSAASMEALLQGTLEVVDGYFRVNGFLIVWQPDFFVNNNNGRIEIWDRDGAIVGIVGELIQMSGGGGWAIEDLNKFLKEPVPSGIDGPVWIQGEGTGVVAGFDENDPGTSKPVKAAVLPDSLAFA